MKPIVQTRLIGRFGNQLFQYAFARAWAEKHGAVLHTPSWVGQRIFADVRDPDITGRELPRHTEFDLEPGQVDVEISSYCQSQTAIDWYSRTDARRWFQFRPDVLSNLSEPAYTVLAHRRVGDYLGYGYVVVSERSYIDACTQYGYPPQWLRFVTEEQPMNLVAFVDWAPFLPDFYHLTRAEVLFRGNSSFSWWAATLSNADVYAPVIEDLTGGQEHDCPFVRGNHPRFVSHLNYVTDLHLRP